MQYKIVSVKQEWLIKPETPMIGLSGDPHNRRKFRNASIRATFNGRRLTHSLQPFKTHKDSKIESFEEFILNAEGDYNEKEIKRIESHYKEG